MGQRIVAWSVSLCVCFLAASQEYRSASKDHCLRVEVSGQDFTGPARYEFLTQDRLVWRQTFPFALSVVGVSNQGSVAGVSYSHGPGGKPGTDQSDLFGDCRLVIIDTQGKLLLDKSLPRTRSRQFHDPPKPECTGILLNESLGVATFRLVDEIANESWLTYELSTGNSKQVLVPRDLFEDKSHLKRLVDARVIPDTPLILVQWWLVHQEPDDKEYAIGSRFALVNGSGKVSWQLDLKADYVDAPQYRVDNKLIARLQTGAAILDASSRREFELWHVRSRQRVRYVVDDGALPKGEWRITELSRTPYDGRE